MQECQVSRIGQGDLGVVIVFVLCHFALNLGCFLKIRGFECVCALLQEFEHLGIVEAKLDICHLDFVAKVARISKLLLYTCFKVLLEQLNVLLVTSHFFVILELREHSGRDIEPDCVVIDGDQL